MFPSSFNNKNNHTDSPSDPYPIPRQARLPGLRGRHAERGDLWALAARVGPQRLGEGDRNATSPVTKDTEIK